MVISNQTNVCKEIELFFNTTSKCFEGVPPPYITDCDLLLLIYRLIFIDCYIERLFFPIAAILVFIGTILNLFSLYCFLKMNKRNSQNVYLSVLSLGDTINLQVNFTIPLLRHFEKIDNFLNEHYLLCRFNGFLTEFFLIFPTWIVVLLTFERLICVLSPLKCHSLYTQKRAKLSISLLAFIVICLSLYRFRDLKGIEQVNVFAIAACGNESGKDSYTGLTVIRHVNLIIWAILPECLTLFMNLVIIYNIKLATQKFEPFYSLARQTKYNQATKTVLLLSILFLIFHTPTGIMIGLNLIYTTNKKTIGILIILVSRKITVILYEISLCGKFFIYIRTFRNFKNIFHTSISRFTRQTNSAKLGRPMLHVKKSHEHCVKSFHSCQNYRTFQFNQIKHDNSCQQKEIDALCCHQRKSSTKTSTSTSRTSREQQQQQQQHQRAVIMIKTNGTLQVSLSETPILLRRYTTGTKTASNNRLLWRSKPQTTL